MGSSISSMGTRQDENQQQDENKQDENTKYSNKLHIYYIKTSKFTLPENVDVSKVFIFPGSTFKYSLIVDNYTTETHKLNIVKLKNFSLSVVSDDKVIYNGDDYCYLNDVNLAINNKNFSVSIHQETVVEPNSGQVNNKFGIYNILTDKNVSLEITEYPDYVLAVTTPIIKTIVHNEVKPISYADIYWMNADCTLDVEDNAIIFTMDTALYDRFKSTHKPFQIDNLLIIYPNMYSVLSNKWFSQIKQIDFAYIIGNDFTNSSFVISTSSDIYRYAKSLGGVYNTWDSNYKIVIKHAPTLQESQKTFKHYTIPMYV